MSTSMETPLKLESFKKKPDEEPKIRPELKSQRFSVAVQYLFPMLIPYKNQFMAHEHGETTSSITTNKTLPPELWLQALGHLQPSKDFAAAGSEQLIKILPDLEKLEMISQDNPNLLANVNEISFETGFVAYSNMFLYLRGKYARKLRTYSDVQGWENNVACESSIDSVYKMMVEYLVEFDGIMLAAHESKLKVRHLVHDSLPVEFFYQDFNVVANVLKPFRDLHTLELSCDKFCIAVPRGTLWAFWSGAWKALQLAPDLRTLCFGMDSHWDISDANSDSIYVPLRKVIGTFTWSSLSHLKLDGMVLCERDLTSFLLRHASSLRHLTLSRIMLLKGSFKGLFDALRRNLKLESFYIEGPIRSLDGELEDWCFMPEKIEISDSFAPDGEDNLDKIVRLNLRTQVRKILADQGDRERKAAGLVDSLRDELIAFVLNKDNAVKWPTETINEVGRPSRESYDTRLASMDDDGIDRLWDLEIEGCRNFAARSINMEVWTARESSETSFRIYEEYETLSDFGPWPLWHEAIDEAKRQLANLTTSPPLRRDGSSREPPSIIINKKRSLEEMD
ncbi:hypothetical protein NHQ30_004559 [Ciborinia camelliae]|nr:hypothetical protein NHQ30_004559 [Ciborinia camelliae]